MTKLFSDNFVCFNRTNYIEKLISAAPSGPKCGTHIVQYIPTNILKKIQTKTLTLTTVPKSRVCLFHTFYVDFVQTVVHYHRIV